MARYVITLSVALRGEDGREAQESLREEVAASVSAVLREDFGQAVRVQVESIYDATPAAIVPSRSEF